MGAADADFTAVAKLDILVKVPNPFRSPVCMKGADNYRQKPIKSVNALGNELKLSWHSLGRIVHEDFDTSLISCGDANLRQKRKYNRLIKRKALVEQVETTRIQSALNLFLSQSVMWHA